MNISGFNPNAPVNPNNPPGTTANGLQPYVPGVTQFPFGLPTPINLISHGFDPNTSPLPGTHGEGPIGTLGSPGNTPPVQNGPAPEAPKNPAADEGSPFYVRSNPGKYTAPQINGQYSMPNLAAAAPDAARKIAAMQRLLAVSDYNNPNNPDSYVEKF